MTNNQVDQVTQTIDAVREFIEILETDTNYKSIPEYKKRNLIRALHEIAISAAYDATNAITNLKDALRVLKVESSTKFIVEAKTDDLVN